MKFHGYLVILILVFVFPPEYSNGQQFSSGERREPEELHPQELFSLSALPPLEVPESYLKKPAPALPWWVDNSTQPYFRSITTQQGFECGQSAGISYAFTYEIDRLRNLPADTIINQYPSHFTWNFLNGGDRYGGASCFDSWEIVRRCGNMNVADYGGGLATGGHKRWISGYDYYYRGMFNRIGSMHSIRVDSPEGLNTLKYWLSDHMEGSDVGGVAILYGTYFHPDQLLPQGTPEGGKYVEATWGPIATHTFTVVGYNDSIRFDYNGDGIYTNHLDITNDGVVDMHDWEIGGLKLASAFDGPSWSNDGFIYTMYKCLADNIGYGGIWNHSVYVIDVRETVEPKLTAKVNLKHTARNKLKVTAGISTELQDTIPEITLEFPIFNFQGGDFYMQGDTTENSKTIEFGLDLTPLVNAIGNGEQARFFLQVEEKDPQGTAEGEIIHFSLIDYTNGSPVTVECPETNVALFNNAVTRLSVAHFLTTQRPVITSDSLPDAELSVPYSFQLEASGGTPPYRWDLVVRYPGHNIYTVTYSPPGGEKLDLTDNNSGYSVVTLPFGFPFYDRMINQVTVYSDGYIAFDDQPFSWPFLIDRMLLYKYSAVICPFMADLDLYPSKGDGIWYRHDDDEVIFSWKASVRNHPGSSNLNFSLSITRTGTMIFNYGTMTYPYGLSWIGGISAGDNLNYLFSLLHNSPSIQKDKEEVIYISGPPCMKITEEGVLRGTPEIPWRGDHIRAKVTDNNNISSEKTLWFKTPSLPLTCEVLFYQDTLLYGEDADIMLKVTNESLAQLDGLSCRLRCNDPYCTVTDSVAVIFHISYYETVAVPYAFSMQFDSLTPDGHTVFFEIEIWKGKEKFRKVVSRIVRSPAIKNGLISLNDDDNQRLDPGETADMTLTFMNTGGATLRDASVVIRPLDDELEFDDTTALLGNLLPGSTNPALFRITARKSLPFNHIYSFETRISGSKGFETSDTSYIYSGEAMEDFESGNFRNFDWKLGGNGKFHLDTVNRHGGRYCAKSGWLVSGQFSALVINANVLTDGEIRFFMKVSCEYDPSGNRSFDSFNFYIDDREMGRWDGEIDWSEMIFPVEKGFHQFRWVYQKDFSYNYGSDCAWLDDITFPPMNRSFPEPGAKSDSFIFNIYKGGFATDTLAITNSGYERLDFSTDIQDISAIPKNLRKTFSQDSSFFQCITDGVIPGQPFTWKFSLYNDSRNEAPINRVRLDICDELTLTGISDFGGGSLGDLTFRTISPDSSEVAWSGKTGWGSGVLLPGETAFATVTGFTDQSLTNDIFLVYTVFFDSVAGKDSVVTGHIRIHNRCLPNSWLTLDPGEGNLIRGDTGVLIMKIDARELSEGTYGCNIVIRDGYNHNLSVPVTVHVIDSTNRPYDSGMETPLLKSYPNPFSREVSIEFDNIAPCFTEAIVYDIFGKRIRTLISEMIPSGKYILKWDRRSDQGKLVEPGVYHCVLWKEGERKTIKLIVVH